MHSEISSHTASDGRSDLGTRIREVRLSKKLTQQAFAKSLGIVQGFLCGIERGRKAPSDTLLLALSHLYEIRLEWLVTGSGEMTSRATAPTGSVGDDHRIPLLERIPAPFPETIAEGDVTEYVVLPGVPTGSFGMVYSGEFMSPTIRDGDIVILSRDEPVRNGRIILFNNRWGEPMLRRYRVRGGEVHLSADNSLYATFRPDAAVRVIAVVIAVWRNVKI